MKSGLALLVMAIAAVSAPAAAFPSSRRADRVPDESNPDLVAGEGDTTQFTPALVTGVGDITRNAVSAIIETIGDTLINLGYVVARAVDPIKGGVDTVVGTIKDVTGIVNSTEHKVAKVVATYVSDENGPTDFFNGLADTVNNVTSTTSGIIDNMSEAAGNAVSGVLAKLEE